jgi:hypothetical protein
MLMNKHTHTCRPKRKFQNCIQPTMKKKLCTHRFVKIDCLFLTSNYIKTFKIGYGNNQKEYVYVKAEPFKKKLNYDNLY